MLLKSAALLLLAVSKFSSADMPVPLAQVYTAGDPCATGNPNPPAECREATEQLLRVAAVQLVDVADGANRSAAEEVTQRTAKITAYLAQAATMGVRIAAFPEMSTILYDIDVVREGNNDIMATAEAAVATACRTHKIWAIVGLPKYFKPAANQSAMIPTECTAEKCWYNTALVIDDTGNKVYRQAKMHHAGNGDGMEGAWLDVFQGPDNVTCSIQICYDAYFPQMTILPVMKGARIVFDISNERGYDDDAYYTAVNPALYQGRAQATGAVIVHSNTGADMTPRTAAGGRSGRWAGSHGNSQILSAGPSGKVLAEAPHTGEHIVVADVPVKGERSKDCKVSRHGCHAAMVDANRHFAAWWRAGLELLGNRMPID